MKAWPGPLREFPRTLQELPTGIMDSTSKKRVLPRILQRSERVLRRSALPLQLPIAPKRSLPRMAARQNPVLPLGHRAQRGTLPQTQSLRSRESPRRSRSPAILRIQRRLRDPGRRMESLRPETNPVPSPRRPRRKSHAPPQLPSR